MATRRSRLLATPGEMAQSTHGLVPLTKHAGAEFLRIGHRGAAAECPENTLASFARALALGVDMIECDLQLTGDGQVVIFHDWTLERTTNGSGIVRELSLDAIRHLDAGSWRDRRFAGERVPTLDETLDLVLPSAQLNLELKCRGPRSDARALAEAAVAAVTRRGAFGRIVFSSFDGACLEELRAVSAEARIGVLWNDATFPQAFERADRVSAMALHPRAATVTPTLVAEAHGRGLRVYTWTVNPLDEILRLVGEGVDGVISDHPGRLAEARARLLHTPG
ncbi:glycerophosphodiester phosphodiesterase [Candidatus Binatia bacterium]|nr:glycerophosphodiester phosphodiesterase [Candidatus Binatia bacterium]